MLFRSEKGLTPEAVEVIRPVLTLSGTTAEKIAVMRAWKAPKPTAKINTKLLEERYPNSAKEITQSVQGSRRFLLK